MDEQYTAFIDFNGDSDNYTELLLDRQNRDELVRLMTASNRDQFVWLNLFDGSVAGFWASKVTSIEIYEGDRLTVDDEDETEGEGG